MCTTVCTCTRIGLPAGARARQEISLRPRLPPAAHRNRARGARRGGAPLRLGRRAGRLRRRRRRRRRRARERRSGGGLAVSGGQGRGGGAVVTPVQQAAAARSRRRGAGERRESPRMIAVSGMCGRISYGVPGTGMSSTIHRPVVNTGFARAGGVAAWRRTAVLSPPPFRVSRAPPSRIRQHYSQPSFLWRFSTQAMLGLRGECSFKGR